MQMRPITANPSQLIVEQLVASGVNYVFYNSGSREAHFFDALYRHPDIHGVLALHEGTVTAMAGGYTQARGRRRRYRGPPWRRTGAMSGATHQRLDRQPAGRGHYLCRRYGQFRRQDRSRPQPQFWPHGHLGAVHQGQLERASIRKACRKPLSGPYEWPKRHLSVLSIWPSTIACSGPTQTTANIIEGGGSRPARRISRR